MSKRRDTPYSPPLEALYTCVGPQCICLNDRTTTMFYRIDKFKRDRKIKRVSNESLSNYTNKNPYYKGSLLLIHYIRIYVRQ